MIKTLLLKHEMHMTRSPTMPPQFLQQLAYRPIIWNRIRHGYNPFEPKHTLIVTRNHCAAIGLVAAVLILHIVLAVGIRFPDVDFDAGDWGPGCGFHSAEDKQRCARGVGRDFGAWCGGRGIVRVEGTKDRTFSGGRGFGVVD